MFVRLVTVCIFIAFTSFVIFRISLVVWMHLGWLSRLLCITVDITVQNCDLILNDVMQWIMVTDSQACVPEDWRCYLIAATGDPKRWIIKRQLSSDSYKDKKKRKVWLNTQLILHCANLMVHKQLRGHGRCSGSTCPDMSLPSATQLKFRTNYSKRSNHPLKTKKRLEQQLNHSS